MMVCANRNMSPCLSKNKCGCFNMFHFPCINQVLNIQIGTAVAQWLRYYAKNQKVTGSIPDGVIEFFIDMNPSDRTMALESTQPLTEMSTRSISWR
jgi:hypothetical protein